MKRLCYIMLFIMSCSIVYAAEPDGRSYFQKGKNALEKKNYEEAVSNLSAAEKEFPLLGDYALLLLSDAYRESGNHPESLAAIHMLLSRYPESPLIKKARSKEIREAVEIPGAGVLPLFEKYSKDYPCDTEMKYLFAQWLKKNGYGDKAKPLFKDIYVEAGPLSGMSYGELSQAGVSVEDMIKRASNLTKLSDHRAAELLLRQALDKDDGKLRAEILKELGQTLFKQKRYREAAEVYRKTGDRFWEVRSLYRAGEKDVVDAALEDILKNGEKKFSPLLIAIAADKRREGKPEEALRIYQTVMKRFPSESEDALWGIGWTHFLSLEYQKASEVFNRLCNIYNDPKYIYWRDRSLEACGKADLKNGQMSTGKGRDFYSIMSYVRKRGSSDHSTVSESRKMVNPIARVKGTPSAHKKLDRIQALFDLGLQKEALSELISFSKETDAVEDILYICSKSQELGEYKLAIRSALKVPYADELHDFLYPLAYWDIVNKVSSEYAVDPFLVLSIVREESRFDSEARSSAGAIGLMQLMPHTAFRIDGKLRLGVNGPRDLLDVKNNLHVGSYYLSRLIKEFGSYPYAVAAYNAGEETVRKWVKRGGYKSVDEFIEDIPYNETRNYVKRVLTSLFEYKRASLTGEKAAAILFEKL